jgi:uncharacterized protein DUF5658
MPPQSCRSGSLSFVVASIALAAGWAAPAAAQHAVPIESPGIVSASVVALLPASEPVAPFELPRIDTTTELRSFQVEPPAPRRPAALTPLYVSFAALQALDLHSTMKGVAEGGAEANPAMKPFVDQPAAFVLAKVVATAATVYVSERLWRRSRVGALVLMLSVNGAYAAIVAKNYRR